MKTKCSIADYIGCRERKGLEGRSPCNHYEEHEYTQHCEIPCAYSGGKVTCKKEGLLDRFCEYLRNLI